MVSASWTAVAVLLLAALFTVPAAAQAQAPAPSTLSLTANVTSLPANSYTVAVSWTGRENASPDDAIAWVQDATTTNYTASPPQKFKWATNSSTALTTGFGTVTFTILNTRVPFKFIFVTNIINWSNSSFTVLASTPAIAIANPNSPTGLRIGLTNITGQARISWTTANETANPIVQYGTASGAYTANATATFDSIPRSGLYGEANTTGYQDAGIFNSALLTNLSAATRYYYRVGDSTAGLSAEFSFQTPPAPGADEVTFFAIADLGYCEVDSSLEWQSDYPNTITSTNPSSSAALQVQFSNVLNGNWLSFCAARQVVNAMIADPFDASLLVHNGDISYAQGFEYGWEVYMDMMQPLTATRPYMVCEGNHERDWPGTGDRYQAQLATDSGGEAGVVNEKRFPMPITPGKLWYTFSYGPVFFIELSTEVDFAPGSEQHNFVISTLMAVNRTTYPWLVVGLHRPYLEPSVYGTNNKGDIANQNDLQAAFDDLFVLYNVDLILFGHTHWYSRSCPAYRKNCIAPVNGTNVAPVSVNIGNAGASFSWDVIDPALMAQDIWQAVAIVHGYSRVNATRTSLNFQAVNTADGSLVDEFTLTKPLGWVQNKTAQANLEAYFQGNGTASWEETYSGNEVDILDNAISALFQANSSEQMLEQLATTNVLANPITGPDAFESFELELPLWNMVDAAFRQYVLNADTTDPRVLYYYNQVYGPQFQLFRTYPNGVFKGPFASAPTPVAPAPGEEGLEVIVPIYTGPGLNQAAQLAPAATISEPQAQPAVSAFSLG